MDKKQQKQKANFNPFPAMEEEVLNFWEKNKIFEKSLEGKDKDYVFYDGPPFATGEPHYGHIVASIMKDAVPRYWTMKGHKIERRWGWDCHGLPVENLAEKELGLKDKTDIEKYGVEKFNDYCQSIVMRYAEEWKKTIRSIGRWVDMENDYKTMDVNFMESVWWVFKNLWDKGLVYQGYKAMHICPRCGTTLSNFEVTQNYKDIKDLSVTIKFELEDEPGTYVLAWTTTPWTLIGNVALAIGKDIDYVKVEILESKFKKGENYIFSRNFLEKTFTIKPTALSESGSSPDYKDYLIHDEKYRGVKIRVQDFNINNLVGKKYKPLFDYYKDEELENKENGWQIYGADFVTIEDGTGVVHIAPAFGEDDMNLGNEYKLPFIQHVDGSGKFKEEVKDWPGIEVKPIDDTQATDRKIVEWLDKNNKLFTQSEYEHSYPHCWRCETPLLNYATASWFVKVTEIRDNLIKNNQKITWVPEHIKDGRFGKWLEQARDWAISRNRYWGTPLPVWVCDKCDHSLAIGSREELEKLSGQKIDNLHKQHVDRFDFKCEKCDSSASSGQGGTMKRIPEVFDCWFESGSMPYGQEHYPFENKKRFEKNFPANFIAEGVDQTRGWFYTLIVLSTALFDKEMAQNVIVNGIVLTKDGQKMSKRLRNYPDTAEIINQYGADAMRYYLFASSVLMAENLNFSEDGVKDVLRKVSMLLWNVYRFYEMYANNDEILSLRSAPLQNDSKNILDKWIVARLNQLISEVTENMDNYVIPKAVRPIGDFIDDLSTWYIRRSRNRFKGEDLKDKQAALNTTRYVLVELSKVMAPFTPFIAEQLWQKVTENNFTDENKSVHLENWVVAEKVDDKILGDMVIVRKIVELGLAKRDELGIKVRQPLAKLIIKNSVLREEYFYLVKDELNVKEIVCEQINKKEQEKSLSVDKDYVEFLSVDYDTTLTPELKLEGTKREIVRLVNNMRRQAKMTIKDKAVLCWHSDAVLIKKVFNDSKMMEELKKDTLSEEIKNELSEENKKELKINEEEIILSVIKK